MTNEFTGPVIIKHCTIQSLLGYFGTTLNDFVKHEDPLKQLYECTKYVDNFRIKRN